MIKLYYSPGTACLAPHFLLEELSVPYELVLVDTSKNQHQEAAYLKINPNGKIPTLIDDDLVLTESAAICLYLADRYGKQDWSPAIASTERAHLYKWMLYLSNTLQAELVTYFYSDRLTEDDATAAQVKSKAEQRVAQMLVYLDESLHQSGGKYLLGSNLTIADLYLFMLCRWTRGMQKPARAYPHLGPYIQSLFERTSIKQVFEQEGITAPYF